jgi:hypothetical protein
LAIFFPLSFVSKSRFSRKWRLHFGIFVANAVFGLFGDILKYFTWFLIQSKCRSFFLLFWRERHFARWNPTATQTFSPNYKQLSGTWNVNTNDESPSEKRLKVKISKCNITIGRYYFFGQRTKTTRETLDFHRDIYLKFTYSFSLWNLIDEQIPHAHHGWGCKYNVIMSLKKK